MGSLGTLVCFVFAIPAALIIYTLSLHDALPISGESLVDLIHASGGLRPDAAMKRLSVFRLDRKSTRLNSSHITISYAVFCLKKKRLAQARPRRAHRAFRRGRAPQGIGCSVSLRA